MSRSRESVLELAVLRVAGQRLNQAVPRRGVGQNELSEVRFTPMLTVVAVERDRDTTKAGSEHSSLWCGKPCTPNRDGCVLEKAHLTKAREAKIRFHARHEFVCGSAAGNGKKAVNAPCGEPWMCNSRLSLASKNEHLVTSRWRRRRSQGCSHFSPRSVAATCDGSPRHNARLDDKLPTLRTLPSHSMSRPNSPLAGFAPTLAARMRQLTS